MPIILIRTFIIRRTTRKLTLITPIMPMALTNIINPMFRIILLRPLTPAAIMAAASMAVVITAVIIEPGQMESTVKS